MIVAVLSLAGAALASGGNRLSTLLTAMALIIFATFAPWTLMRILPFTEVAASAAGMMRHELPQMSATAGRLAANSIGGAELATSLPARLSRQTQEPEGGLPGRQPGMPEVSWPAPEPSERVPTQSTSESGGEPSEYVATPVGRDPASDGAEQPREPSTEPRRPARREPVGTPQPPVGTSASAGPSQPTEPSGEGRDAARADEDRPTAEHDPRGPFQLPAMWNTGSEPSDDLPEIRLGPAFLTGPFDVDRTSDGPVDGEPE